MIAFLFPGQGAEAPLMGLELSQSFAPARLHLERARAAAGTALRQLLERGGRELTQTEVLQPALVAVSLGALEFLAGAGVHPDFVAGHSLGEVPAICAALAMTAGDAIDLSAVRGRLMAREAARSPGGMIAVAAASEEALEPMLKLGRRSGALSLAAHNAPDEWVLSGEHRALAAVSAKFGGKPVPTHGPWHSSAMAPAVAELAQAARARISGPAKIPLVLNRDGKVAPSSCDFGLALAEQLTRPIRWAATLAGLAQAGVTHWVTVGPGKLLRSLVRRNLGKSIVHSTEDAAELARTVEALCR